MEDLQQKVVEATGLDPATAKAAIGHVLLFLRDETPDGHVAEVIDKDRLAREAARGAAASGDAGLTAAIEGVTSLMGHGRWDVNTLAARLVNLGLRESQIIALVSEIETKAETLIGADGAAKLREALPALAQRLSGDEALRRD